jgi:uncharacterized protein HemX
MKKLFLFAALAFALGLGANSGLAWGDVRIDLTQHQDQQRQYQRDRWQRDQWQMEQHRRNQHHERAQTYDLWLGLHLHDYDKRR